MPTLQEVREDLITLELRRTALGRQVEEAYLVESDCYRKAYDTPDGLRRLREARENHEFLKQQLTKVVTAYAKWEKMEKDLLDAMPRIHSRPLPAAPSPFARLMRWFMPEMQYGPPPPQEPPTPPPRSPLRREDHPSSSHTAPPPPHHPAPAPPPPARSWPGQPTLAQWRDQCAACFADYAGIEKFPTPPSNSLCYNQACDEQHRKLPLCSCQIRHTLAQVPGLNLKRERNAWHPDKFAACREDKRKEFQEMATETFVVVMEMLKVA
ncbi:hypothetical protein CLAFUR4_08626 [Fulvia fulva]|nr:hypothetical protein CLAFUR4_08626 [Fulvia fulva]WPV27089.1 hypothetical protein CLAFUW7_08621 [Fulvia fulva]